MAKGRKGKLLFERKAFTSGRMKIEDGLMPVFDKVRILVSRKKLGADGKALLDASDSPIMEKIGKLDKNGQPVYDMKPVMQDGKQLMTPRLMYLEPSCKGKALEFEDTEYVLKKYPAFFKKI